ncbi:MAG: ribosomal-processing cysteine protease Prp [Solobacterium sp.]|nr:ribosomal-processing cysteine protease Prp [Solobacterium sp.]
MIRAVLTVEKGEIRALSISGHSGSAEYGRDLICAAVSAIGFGICNALDELGSSAKCEVNSNQIRISECGSDALTQTILQTAVIQLRTVEEGNTEFLSIKENGGV